jgi:hypothetical protein
VCPTLRRARNADVLTLRYETAHTILAWPDLNRFNNPPIAPLSFSDKELRRLKTIVETMSIKMA